jgi:NADPH:quinone reductase-like Zn-dependent oxidoreductase
VVETLGAHVNGFKAGDAVYGLNDWFTNGAEAEYCLVPATALARKPRLHDHFQAAVVPISALTAWQAFMEKAPIKRGQRVLIHGGAGAVGVFAVQLARWRGAHVIATASCGNLSFVRAVGAHEVIDHRETRFADVARNIDLVFDTVGGETLERSWAVLAPGGRLVTVAAQSAGSADQRVRDAFLLVRADGSQLAQIANLIDAGELCAFVEKVFPLAAAREAYAHAERGRNRGKVALQVAG